MSSGLAACWMCAPLFCPEVVRRALELPADWQPDRSGTHKTSHALPIAIALAVTIPLSLLVGAIIGFIVRGRL